MHFRNTCSTLINIGDREGGYENELGGCAFLALFFLVARARASALNLLRLIRSVFRRITPVGGSSKAIAIVTKWLSLQLVLRPRLKFRVVPNPVSRILNLTWIKTLVLSQDIFRRLPFFLAKVWWGDFSQK